MKRIILLFACLLLTMNILTAQINQGGQPLSIGLDKSGLSEVPFEVMDDVDLDVLRAEDAVADTMASIPYRFGYNHYVSLNPENSGVWDKIKGEDRIWRLGIKSEGALTINLAFDKYRLPKGAKLFVYNEDRSHLIGAFTDFNNQDDMKFATTLVNGDAIIIEYFEPADAEFKGELNLWRVTHGYRSVGEYAEKAFGGSGACNVNVACPESAGWENQINSVAMLVSGGSGFCTGTLINNTENDGTPYFLSANHCYDDPGTLVFWFNWQSETCTNPGSSPTHDDMSGAVQRARNADSDFWLMELNQIPPPEYGVYYAGWNRTLDATVTGTIVGIHHPSADIKKFSWANGGATTSSYLGDTGDGTTHWRVGSWSDGTTTEGGSSGSALFDPQGRLMGQLHGGYAACGNTDPDWYGRLGVSWTGGGTDATRLSNWLDPFSSGVDVIDGFDPNLVECDAPTTQASAFNAANIQDNQMDISWSRGNGDAVIVVAREGAAVSSNPYSGNDYIANAVFGSGDNIGSGYVVYKGTGTNVTVTGLTAGTEYHYAIYEYYTADLCYLTPGLAGNAQTTGTAPCTHCYSYGHTSWETSTTGVLFNTIDNASGKPTDGSGNAYSDYTAISTDVEPGLSYDLSVRANTDGSYTTHTVVWIDWDQNCNFDDAGEMYELGTADNVADGLTSNSPFSILVPETAAEGPTIMRVSTKYNAAATSCEQNFDGEVEDYTINVLGGSSVLLGDVNDDGFINVVDIVWLVNYILGNPDPAFNEDAADVNEDTNIDVADVSAIANLILGGAKNSNPVDSETAYVFVEDGKFKFESDGSIVGLQFEIIADNANEIDLDLLFEDYELAYAVKDNVITGLIYSLENKTFPEGTINLLNTDNLNSFEWGHLVAANYNAESTEVLPKDATGVNDFEISSVNVELYPNPNSGSFNLTIDLPSEALIEMQLFDVTGRKVMDIQPTAYNKGINQIEVNNTHNLERGFYILSINGFNMNNNLLFRRELKVLIEK